MKLDGRIKLLRMASVALACVMSWAGIYWYLWSEAEPFAPAPGQIFSREPLLAGEYRYESPGNKIHRSLIGDTQVWCGGYSYYDGTWAQVGSYFDCGRKDELLGKRVEIERVRLPRKNEYVGPVVTKIASDGNVYLERSDSEIRNLWIQSTRSSASGSAMLVTILVGAVFWGASGYMAAKWRQEEDQNE